ncbi:MAG: DUF1016 N-terminal domain-containing protein, partial [Dysgonamonadaceae bacterium]|nr:DUF1016 N-terminal domain-containing protein [Dysgonamonadaceae bacterium]
MIQKITNNYADAVKVIKQAILRSQYRAVSAANREQLSLYYGIGRYVSDNSRVGFWGTGAIEKIAQQLQKELPGLRGFSARNMRNMRIFYDEWTLIWQPTAAKLQDADVLPSTNWQPMAAEIEANRQPSADDLRLVENKHNINHPPMAADLTVNENLLLSVIWPPTAADFNQAEFLQIGFSHHIEILSKTKSLDARLFYIHECATRFWSKYTLRDYLKTDLYGKRGSMPNNFEQTMPDVKNALKAIGVFKDEYLLDYFNVEQYGERDDDIDERVLEQGIIANIRRFIMTFGQDFSF